MKISNSIRMHIITVISYLYIFLFVYAACSKLIDFELFKTQLGQSPILTAYASSVAILVPAAEFLIVFFLFLPKTRLVGLILAYLLMVVFTVYIVIILNFSSFVPCSCGGILEKMDWTTHLLFNALLTGLAFTSILLSRKKYNNFSSISFKKFLILLLGVTVLAVGFVVVLFLTSEQIVRERNPFVRQFPFPVHYAAKKIDLKVNSFYFAGTSSDSIYLGNSTSPLTVVSFSKSLGHKRYAHIALDTVFNGYSYLQLSVSAGNFYLMDGTVPCIYKGKISQWKGRLLHDVASRFSVSVPQDSTAIAFRQFSTSQESNVLGLFKFSEGVQKYLNNELLVKQDAPFFDTDGMLLFNAQRNTFHYIYAYRNEYLTMDAELQLVQSGRTIDTVSKAKLSVKKVHNSERILDAPPLIINKKAAVFGAFLFVQSDRLGKYDAQSKLRNGSIIDVYDIGTATYRASIYLENVNHEKLDGFIVDGNHLYFLSGRYLSFVDLKQF